MPSFALQPYRLLLAAAALACSAVPAQAAYPDRAIELVVPASPGGGTDTVARAFSEAARKHLPVPLTVLNKPGASGAIGMGEVAHARPDGYKIGFVIAEAVILPHLGPMPYALDELVPIARLNADPAAVTVKADAPWNTIEEFLKYAKDNPGKVQVGNSGPGSIWHLAATALEDRTGTRFNHIPFSGAAPAVQALIGGHVEAVSVSPAEVAAFVSAGSLKTLAVMADQRVKGFDKVPTLKERGIDLSIGTWRGLAAPKGTPPEVLQTLSAATRRIVAEPVFTDALARISLGLAYEDGPAFKADMTRDLATMKGLVEKTQLKR